MNRSKEQKRKKRILDFIVCVLLSFLIMLIADIVSILFFKGIKLAVFWSVFAVLVFALFFCEKKIKPKAVTAGILLAAVVLFFASFGIFSRNAVYKDVESGKEQLYENKRVMIIVPHEDDDLNLTGGVADEYIKHKSEVCVVFVTNGDKFGLGEERINEALNYYRYMGVPEKNIIFMGYGDCWDSSGPHIYNSMGDRRLKSFIGRTETYGIKTHGAFHNGEPYTYNNLMSDMKEVILTYRPDVIFCSDCDNHADHKAVSMEFERAMGVILKENPDYRPEVFKGYAYRTSYLARPDFYELNIASTVRPDDRKAGIPSIYDWDKRVRFPVTAECLSRSISSSKLIKEISFYSSQDEINHVRGIINSDRVYWQRDTRSVLHDAEIKVSSGDASHLNDFMISDDDDVNDSNHLPFDNVWTPDKSDTSKQAEIILKDAKDIDRVVIYDNPSPDDNIKSLSLEFDNGSSVVCDNINKNGAATEIKTGKRNISKITVKILQYEGDNAGIAEIEAFSGSSLANESFFKLTDSGGNFVYDYIIENGDRADFGIYKYGGVSPVLNNDNFSVKTADKGCSAAIKNGKVVVSCKSGKHCRVTVTDKKSGITDTVYVRNPRALETAFIKVMQKIDESYYKSVIDYRYSSYTPALFRTYEKVKRLSGV